MKIVYYEMRKSWLKITTLIVLAVLSVFDILCLSDACRRSNDRIYGEMGESYYRAYDKFCGKITRDKIDTLKRESDELAAEVSDGVYSTNFDPERYTGYIFGDFALLNIQIKSEMTYCILYPNTSNKIAAKAYENIDFYENLNCSFEADKNKIISKMYSGRSIPEYRTTAWAEAFFKYDFSSLLCVIMLIFGLSSIFSTESESGMIRLIVTSGHSGKTVASKILSSAVYCVFLSIYFTLLDLIFVNIFLGIDGMNMPIYSAQMFEKAPFGFSFFEAIMLYSATRFLALFAIALLILFFSYILFNSIASICVSFGFVIILIALSMLGKNIFNPINMLIPCAYLKDFEVYNIFGIPVISLFAAVTAIALICAVLIILILIVKRIRGGKVRV